MEIVKVSQKFSDDFSLVASHYRLAESGELEAAKSSARRDMPAAITAFSSFAAEIRKST